MASLRTHRKFFSRINKEYERIEKRSQFWQAFSSNDMTTKDANLIKHHVAGYMKTGGVFEDDIQNIGGNEQQIAQRLKAVGRYNQLKEDVVLPNINKLLHTKKYAGMNYKVTA